MPPDAVRCTPVQQICMAIARADRDGRHDEAADLRLELRKAKLAAKIREAVDAAPPLTTEQITELRALLAPSSTPEAA